MYYIIPYTPSQKECWDKFIHNARNSTFQFYRDYLEYKPAQDSSFMVFDGPRLIMVFPAARDSNNSIISHPNCGAGGFVFRKDVSSEQIVNSINFTLTSMQNPVILIKQLPMIFHHQPIIEDAFYLNSCAYNPIAHLTSYIDLTEPSNYSTLRVRNLKKDNLNNIRLIRSNLKEYWDLVTLSLQTRHHSNPTHSYEEMQRLSDLFFSNIMHYGYYINNKLIAGITAYADSNILHAQYSVMHPTEHLNENALTFLHHHLIQTARFSGRRYYSFGRSDDAGHINYGLLQYKNSFGSKNLVYYDFKGNK